MAKHLHLQIFSVPLHSQTPRGGAVVARWAHNPKVVGSSPAPATKTRVAKATLFSYTTPTALGNEHPRMH